MAAVAGVAYASSCDGKPKAPEVESIVANVPPQGMNDNRPASMVPLADASGLDSEPVQDRLGVGERWFMFTE